METMEEISKLEMFDKFLGLASKEGVISFCSAKPDEKVFPLEELRKIYQEILKRVSPKDFQYSSPLGYYPLRELVLDRLRAEKIKVEIDEVMVTLGSQSAISLAIKSLSIKKGTVLVEEPSYLGIKSLLRLEKEKSKAIKVKGIPVDEDGINVDLLEKFLGRCFPRIKWLYLVADFQNPTGALLRLERRKKLASLARRYNFFILEDQTYSDLVYEDEADVPPIKLFNSQKVILVGSFSKTILPGLRVGWLVAPREIIKKAILFKKVEQIFNDLIPQIVVYEFLKRGLLPIHLEKIRKYYKQKRNCLIMALKKNLPRDFSWWEPKGGFFVWVRGPAKFDSQKLFFSCLENQVAFLPGFLFYTNEAVSNFFRLSFSEIKEDQIEKGVAKIAETYFRDLKK